MNLSKGQLIGVSYSNSKLVDLLCHIEKVESDVIHLWIVNGQYEAEFNSKTSMIKNKYNEVEARLVDISKTPRKILKSDDYNIILNYLNRAERE